MSKTAINRYKKRISKTFRNIKKKILENRKLSITVMSISGVILLSLGLFLIFKTRPNDNIFVLGSNNPALYANKNPKFEVNFGKKEQPEDQWVRFESKPSAENPFESEKPNFFQRVFHTIKPKESLGVEMSLVGMDVNETKAENLGDIEEEVKSVAEILGTEEIETSTSLVEMGREIGVYDDEQIISKETIVNESVGDGIDLEYQILAGVGVKEEIVIQSLEAFGKGCLEDSSKCKLPLNEYTFDLKLDEGVNLRSGLYTVKGKTTEAYYFENDNGEYLSHFLPSFAIDGAGSKTYDVDFKIEEFDEQNYKIVVTADLEWLLSDERTFPIRIDPSIVHDDEADFSGGYYSNTEYDTSEILLTPKDYKAGSDTVVLYNMDETADDSCSGGNDVCNSASSSYHGIVTGGTTIVEGKRNNARSFDGIDDYIEIGSGLSDFTGGFTAAFWAKPTASTYYARFFDFGESAQSGSQNIVLYRLDTSNTLYFDVGNGSTTQNLSVSNAIINDEWHHYAVTIDSSGYARMYRDAVQIGAQSLLVPGSSSRTYNYIGKSNWAPGDDLYEGYIDEFEIADRNYSQSEIEEIYNKAFYNDSGVYGSSTIDTGGNQGINSFSWTDSGVNTGDGETPYSTTGLVAQWNLNETSGTTVVSGGSCGTSCNGTVTNAVTTGQDDDASSGWTYDDRKWGGGAIKLDGSNDYISYGNNTAMNVGSADFTWSAWINPDTLSDWSDIYAQESSSPYATGGSVMWEYMADGSLTLGPYGLGTTSSDTGVIKTGIWQHVVVAFDSTTFETKFYVDGVYVGGGTHTGNWSFTLANATTGVRYTQGTPVTGTFDGVIDALQVYTRKLSESEIQSNYQSGNIEFEYRYSDDGTTWSDWEGGSGKNAIEYEVYRRKIDIVNSGSALTDFTIYFDMDTQALISAGKMKNDCGDLRIVSEKGQEYPYYFDLCNTDDTNVYAQIPNIAGSATTSVYLEYGNSTLEADVNTDDLFDVFDDFNDGVLSADWVESGGGDTWIEADGVLKVSEHDSTYTYLTNNSSSITKSSSFKIDSRMKLQSSTWGGFYLADTIADFNINRYAIRNTGNSEQPPNPSVSNSSTWYEVEFISPNNTIYLYNDDVLAYTETAFGSTGAASGYFGLTSNYSAGTDFWDYFKVYEYSEDIITTLNSTETIRRETSDKYSLGKDSSVVTCKSLLTEGNTTSGTYAIDPDGDGTTKQVYCDMTYDGGGWMLLDNFVSSNSGDSDPYGAALGDSDIRDATDLANADYEVYMTTIEHTGYTRTNGYLQMHYSSSPTGYIQKPLPDYADEVYVKWGNWHVGTANLLVGGTTVQTLSGSPGASTYQGYYEGGDLVRFQEAGSSIVWAGEVWIRDSEVGDYIDQGFSSTEGDGYSNIQLDVANDNENGSDYLLFGDNAYTNYNVDDSIVAHWDMNDEDILDKSYAGRSATVSGTLRTVEGIFGNAKEFDGSSYISIPDSNDLDLASKFSVSAWIKRDAIGTQHSVVEKYNWTSGQGSYLLRVTSANKVYAAVINGTGSSTCTGSTDINAGSWYHIGMTFNTDTNTLTCYVNGEIDNQNTSATVNPPSSTNALRIGARGDDVATKFDGVIDEVVISNVERSEDEMKEVYEYDKRLVDLQAEFKAELESSNLISGSSDKTFTIDEVGEDNIVHLAVGEEIVIKEKDGKDTYIAEGIVKTLNTSTGAVEVHSWNTDSTFPSGGFTTDAIVYKWELKSVNAGNYSGDNNISSLTVISEESISKIRLRNISWYKGVNDNLTNTDEQLSNLDTGASTILHKEGTAAEVLGASSTNVNFTSKDLSGYTKIPFWIASDKLGSNILATYGESKYANYEPDANTVVFWDMEEGEENSCSGGADICDLSSNGFNGTFVGTAEFTTDTVKGDYAVLFDGNSDYVSIPSNQALNDVADTGASATYEAWINIGTSSNAQNIFSKMHTVNNQALYSFEVYQGKIQFLITGGSTDKYISDKSVINPGEWHHVAVTHTYGTGSSTKMYLDGRLIDATWNYDGNRSLDSSNTNPMFIGHADHTSFPAWLNGRVDDVRISNIARSATDIKQAYEVGRRSHEVTVDFKADLQSSNLISSSSDQSFIISELPYSADLAIENIKVGETVIVKEGSSDTYEYSMPLTVDNTQVSGSAPLSNFPAFIDIQSDNLKTEANGGHVTQATGDFNFTNSAGDTDYSFEIESYNGTTGSLKAWVRIPSLSNSSDTSFKIQYGHGSYVDQEDAEGVWDANYSAVWHMNESSGTVYDSTSNNNDLVTVNGSPDYSQDGKTGSSINFDGSSEYFRTSGGATTNFPTGSSSFTTQVWYRPDDAGSHDGWIMWGNTSTSQLNAFRRLGSTGYRHYFWGNDLDASGSVSAGNWYMGAATYNGTTRRVFHNGSQVGSHNPSAPNVQSGSLYVGKTYNAEYWDGRIDEVRVSKVDRGGDWLATEYNNQNSPSTFMILGSETQEITDIYYAQGTVDSINTSTGAITVSSWDDGSTFPTGGFTTGASVFKWQREFIDLRLTPDKDTNTDAVTDITFRRLNSNANIYIDDIRAGEDLAYIGTPQYFQYRTIFTTTDMQLTPTLSSVTIGYLAPTVTGPTNAQLMRHGMWFSGTGEKQCFWWAGECGGSSAVCGNSTCEAGENASTCPGDCPASCGDGFCTHTENSVTCNADCAGSPTTYEYNMPLTVDNTKVSGTSNMSNFPVLVDIQSDNLKTFSNGGHVAQSTGDFKFTNTAGDTDYDFELESYNETTGSVRAWVRIPTLQATSDTSFKIWYGNAQYVNQENAEGVWNTNYSAVWHMDEGSGTVYDSTSNSNDLTTTNGAPLFGQTGRVGDGISFDGSDDNLFGSTVAGLSTTNLTLSVWAYLDSTSESGAFIKIGKEVGTGTDNNGYGLGVGGSNFNNNGNDIIGLYEGVIWRDTGVTIGTGWHNVVLTVDGSSVPRYYLDGSLVNTGSGTPYTPTLGGVKIGGYTASNNDNRFVDSVLDEIRVSTTLRNADWLLTEYNNINSPSTFISVGAEQ